MHYVWNGLKIHFLSTYFGAPKFTIVTARKPLLPLFHKPTAKLPPCIEQCVVGMKDGDFEMKYKPGIDEADPLDFLSRHPLPNIGNHLHWEDSECSCRNRACSCVGQDKRRTMSSHCVAEAQHNYQEREPENKLEECSSGFILPNQGWAIWSKNTGV